MGEELSPQAEGASPAGKASGCLKNRSTVKLGLGLALEFSFWVCLMGPKGKERVPWNTPEPVSS